MDLPEAFRCADLGGLDRRAAHDAFGTLISQVEGAPFATHLPVFSRRVGEAVTLRGECARPNRPWRNTEIQRAFFIFDGPHA